MERKSEREDTLWKFNIGKTDIDKEKKTDEE